MGRGLTQCDWNYAQTKRRDKVYVYVYLYIYLDMLKIRSIRNAVAEWKIVLGEKWIVNSRQWVSHVICLFPAAA